MSSDELLDSAVQTFKVNLNSTRKLVQELYSPMMNEALFDPDSARTAIIAEIRNAIGERAKTLSAQLAMLLEWLGLPDARSEFLQEFKTTSAGGDEAMATWWHSLEGDGVYSPTVDVLDKFAFFLPTTEDPKVDFDERSIIDVERVARVEHILEMIPGVIQDLGETPAKEAHIQKHVDRHLRAAFPDFVKTPSIAKPIAKFQPDCGIIGLRLAIEVKYVTSANDFKEAYRGISEDLSGYAGSRDWTRFYSYIYMNGAWGTEKQFEVSLGLHGTAGSWKTKVVTGPGT